MGPSLLFKIKTKWSKVKDTHFFRYGFPFLAFIVGSSFALTQFTSIRYEITASKQRAAGNIDKKDERFDVEEVLKDVQSELKDDYVNIRGPREYEEDSDAMDLLLKKIDETKKKRQNVIIQTLDYLSNK